MPRPPDLADQLLAWPPLERLLTWGPATLVLDWARFDPAPAHRQPNPRRLALATGLAVVLSLVADAVLVAVGTRIFPATKGFVHFRFFDYASLTILGVLGACVGWPVVTRLCAAPRWLFLRLAFLVTLVLFLPDAWIFLQGESGQAVVVLMAMHVAIAVVTYNVLVHVAPPRSRAAARRGAHVARGAHPVRGAHPAGGAHPVRGAHPAGGAHPARGADDETLMVPAVRPVLVANPVSDESAEPEQHGVRLLATTRAANETHRDRLPVATREERDTHGVRLLASTRQQGESSERRSERPPERHGVRLLSEAPPSSRKPAP